VTLEARLTELHDGEHPTLLGGMGGAPHPARSIAVSANGGLGGLDASTVRHVHLVDELVPSGVLVVRFTDEARFGIENSCNLLGP
jgi:NAD(P)H-dependent flavin oxidoreductase YrpB (nitropropane dioxygenase family)